MNINSTGKAADQGPELDLSNSPNEGLASSITAFIAVTPPPYVIFTSMSDEAAEIARTTLDAAYETSGILWSRWGHNQWRIRK